jgi:hypothetical protein
VWINERGKVVAECTPSGLEQLRANAREAVAA